MHAKNRLEDKVFDSLDAMMAAYADEAVRVARAEHGVRLDYADADNGDTLVRLVEGILEEMLDPNRSQVNDHTGGRPKTVRLDIEYATRLWGGYLGELVRRRYNGTWEMSVYPGGAISTPTLEVKGSRLYPLMKVHRRLTLGAAEDIAAFYAMVVARLGEPVAD